MVAGNLHFVLSDVLPAEYRQVLLRPSLAQRHGLTEAELDQLLEGLVMNAHRLIPYTASACRRTPKALATLRTVAKLGLPFSLSAL
jgi:hypothetical protein